MIFSRVRKVKENNTTNRCVFTIDLLKGHGIPFKSGPAGLAIIVIAAFLPSLLGVMIYGLHKHNNDVIRIKQQEIVNLQDMTAGLSESVKMKNTLDNEKIIHRACLSEVKASIGKFDQWSPVLVTLVEELPASVALTDLAIVQGSIEKEVPKKDDAKKKVKINVPVTKLILKVNNDGRKDCREEVKEFRDRLCASSVLGPKLQDIAFSRKSEMNEGKETVSYEIVCLFKPES